MAEQHDPHCFLEYLALVAGLERMILDGTDESAAGEELRDRMDRPWFGMGPRCRSLAREVLALISEVTRERRDAHPAGAGRPGG